MIISRTPLRISFLGGGTDYPAWYREHGGEVIAATIDKYCYLACRRLPPFFDHRFRVVYSKIENVRSVEEIGHDAVREILRYLGMTPGLEIHYMADLPARSGIGSSSAFTVGLLHALHALAGRTVGKRQLAAEAIEVEQERLRENVGSQDQVVVAHGGLSHVRFPASGPISLRPLALPEARLREFNDHVLLFFTGIQRTASQVAGGYIHDLERCRRHLRTIQDLVREGLSVLEGAGDVGRFGGLLHEAWQAKRALGPGVSTPRIDELYDLARAAGALGGKLLGAGGGGFLMVFAPPERHARIKETLAGLLFVPCRFEFTGSQIVFHAPEADAGGPSVAAGAPAARPLTTQADAGG